MSRLPMRSEPPAARLPALGVPPRLPVLPAARLLAEGAPPPRPAGCWPAEGERPPCPPRDPPPYLSCVARSPYGAPPRCAGLCCQLPLPAPPPRLRLIWLKLLLTLMFTSLLPPQPQPPHDPHQIDVRRISP